MIWYTIWNFPLKMRLDDFLLLAREWTDSHYILLLFVTIKCNILLISCVQVDINSLWEHKTDRTLVSLSLYDPSSMKTLDQMAANMVSHPL